MDLGFFKGIGINYQGSIDKIKKSKNLLQPIYEAFTNSLESIKDKSEDCTSEEIIISLYQNSNLTSAQTNEYEYSKIKIYDTGLGFNEEEFERFQNLNDNKKGYSNHGTGRVQYLHFFKETKFKTISKNESSKTGYIQKEFTLSKSNIYLANNAIIHIDSYNEINSDITFTEVTFGSLLDEKDEKKYSSISIETLKIDLINHFLDYFCENRSNLPKIKIQKFIDENESDELYIKAEDIPQLDKEVDLEINYTGYASNGKDIEKSSDIEVFKLKAYKINANKLEKNDLKLTSKGQIVTGKVSKNIKLNHLKEKDIIDEHRYLFLLSSNYINSKDVDTRGELQLYSLDEFKKLTIDEATIDIHKEILIDDIIEKVNVSIETLYSEIKEEVEKQNQEITKLKNMFLLNEETIGSIKINVQDTESTILKKVYKADSEIIAKRDIKIKEQIDSLDSLDTSAENYLDNLNEIVTELVKIIPIQNRTALTHYVARRKLVLNLFEKILNSELDRQKSGERNIDKKLLHNLIFQQTSDNPEDSDLWLINEDFVYFKGTSEGQLGDIKIDDNSIMKDTLSDEEMSYRLKQQGDANRKRPDILLFPNEGKCILIEFKAPDVNVSEHLNQLNKYASLINNLSKDEYKFTTFYGYLIGENIDVDDIIDNDSDFISADSLNYIFRPYKRIIGKFGRNDGSLYTEVIKYSTILERAKRRNEMFIRKLMNTVS